jgi:hypothetical protein
VIVLDLFAGTGSSTQAFTDAGCRVVSVEMDLKHQADHYCDVSLLTVADLKWMCGGVPSFVWASPPCTAFSVASLGHHWGGGFRAYQPKTLMARKSIALVQHLVGLIEELAPPFWLMENPLGVMRKLASVQHLQRWTVTYCQYGDERQKRTDLWGKMPTSWSPKPQCKRGDPCHIAAPAGSKTGTQGRSGAVERSRVPYGLSKAVADCILAAPAASPVPETPE